MELPTLAVSGAAGRDAGSRGTVGTQKEWGVHFLAQRTVGDEVPAGFFHVAKRGKPK